ncbi:PPE family protein [Mycobacterium bourgelatii]|nr:PPE family protein [Mycobacterium bourgelatii]
MNFTILPPEINSALIFGGAGTGSILEAAASWETLASELDSAARAFASVTTALAGNSWQGPASAAMVDVAGHYLHWLVASGTQAQQFANEARMVAAAFEATMAATVDPAAVLANRARFLSLVTSNLLGFNGPAIALAEAEYEQMWAQDVAAMFDYYIGASAAVSALAPFPPIIQNLAGGAAATSPIADGAFSNPPGRASIFNLGLANFGTGNLGFGSIGNWNVGAGNVGVLNVGFGNLGDFNLGSGNVGGFNLGSGNLGSYNFGPGNLGSFNVGFGNLGDYNFGLGNAGVGNIGFGNTGSNNIGFGLTGDNQVGFGGWNSGSGNVGLFNSGTGNVGFFNSGEGTGVLVTRGV